MLLGADRYWDVAFMDSPCMFACIEGVAKLKLDDGCNDGAAAVEKFGEN